MKKARVKRFAVHLRPWMAMAAAVLLSVPVELCLAQTENMPKPDKDMLGYPNDPAKAVELGQADARHDLSNGVMMVKSAGLPGPAWGEYTRLLKEQCNVELLPIAGCIVSEGLLAYLRGYNETSTAAIKQKFGADILAELDKEADARWQKKHAKADLPANNGGYSVKSGDTLTKIARLHGVSFSDLLKANPGVNPNRLQVKQRIIIPKNKQP
ncbi:MAG: LysM peptidoglycan-binding domain-containing protein [Verrucomicrobiae bacterium]|nr:LysM peptidoglycan-binding domain-containing protein [Verrucomicrobiae bacterium]